MIAHGSNGLELMQFRSGTRLACQVFVVPHAMTRTLPLLALAALFASACVDAPITPAQVSSDGQLHVESALNTPTAQQTRTAAAPQVSGLLAVEHEGPVEDLSAFPAETSEVHLHIRADGLTESRPVTFVWTYQPTEGDPVRDETAGLLEPHATLQLAASRQIDPEMMGTWSVAVYGVAAMGPAPLLFERSFTVGA